MTFFSSIVLSTKKRQRESRRMNNRTKGKLDEDVRWLWTNIGKNQINSTNLEQSQLHSRSRVSPLCGKTELDVSISCQAVWPGSYSGKAGHKTHNSYLGEIILKVCLGCHGYWAHTSLLGRNNFDCSDLSLGKAYISFLTRSEVILIARQLSHLTLYFIFIFSFLIFCRRIIKQNSKPTCACKGRKCYSATSSLK